MNYRPLRVAELLKEEINRVIVREIELEGTLVTVTEVGIDKKLGSARVGVSILPPGKANPAFKILKAAEGRLQYLVMEKIHIKPFPKIVFFLDHGPEHAAQVEKLLIEDEKKK